MGVHTDEGRFWSSTHPPATEACAPFLWAQRRLGAAEIGRGLKIRTLAFTVFALAIQFLLSSNGLLRGASYMEQFWSRRSPRSMDASRSISMPREGSVESAPDTRFPGSCGQFLAWSFGSVCRLLGYRTICAPGCDPPSFSSAPSNPNEKSCDDNEIGLDRKSPVAVYERDPRSDDLASRTQDG